MKIFICILLIFFQISSICIISQTKEDTLKTLTHLYLNSFQKGDIIGSFNFLHSISLSKIKDQMLSAPYFKTEWESKSDVPLFDSLLTMSPREFIKTIAPTWNLDFNKPIDITIQTNIIGILYDKSNAFVVYETKTFDGIDSNKEYVEGIKFERDNTEWKIIK